ncbi:putative tetratricopeptide-like helical domain superfamily [Helianthus annuus]|nr:putative tetratricopeptide-like helical domain superfamily [Helianthus annuus]
MPERNVVSWNSMLDGYVKCGCVEDAVKMFRHMPRSDVVSWNAMLACYAVTL